MEAWSDFFVATAGAAAALAGLIIVAMSVNIEVIVKFPAVPARAASTIANLILVVIVTITGVIPAVGDQVFGWVVIAGSLACLAIAIVSAVRLFADKNAPPHTASFKGAVGIVPALVIGIGGGILVAGSGAGVYWVAAGILLVFVGSVLNAWVLLVELRR